MTTISGAGDIVYYEYDGKKDIYIVSQASHYSMNEFIVINVHTLSYAHMHRTSKHISFVIGYKGEKS